MYLKEEFCLHTFHYVMFINDVVKELPKGVKAALYADDLVMWCTEDHAATATYRMQMALDKLSAWTDKWCLHILKDKSAATLFTLTTQKLENWHWETNHYKK